LLNTGLEPMTLRSLTQEKTEFLCCLDIRRTL